MSIFSDITATSDEADAVRSSTHREQDVYPDEADRSGALSDQQAEAIDTATTEARTDIFAGTGPIDDGPLPEWVPPRVRQARRRAAKLPGSGHIAAQEERLAAIARHGGQPEELAEAIAHARVAIKNAYDVLNDARDPEIATRPKSPAHKEAAQDAIDAARVAVDDAVQVGNREDITAQQYENLTSGIADAQVQAAEALAVAASAFAEWRNLIDGADALARDTGLFGDWHRHKDERSINPRGLIGDLRRARDLAQTDDPYLSGRYLYDDPTPDGAVPEWTREALLASTQQMSRDVAWRLQALHHRDPAAHDSIRDRDLKRIFRAPIPALHPKSPDGFEPNYDHEADWN